jgi:predicted N-formylglutamate amidohydrolase
MTPRETEVIPRVLEAVTLRGDGAKPGAVPDLLLEVPHGATRAADFAALRDELRGPFPEGLQDFFFVNTDVGAPEVALRTAERHVAARPDRTAMVIRCLIPRTFIDCNRVIDADTRPAASAAGQMTPGVANYIRDPLDFALLVDRYSRYREFVERAFANVCGAGGAALMVHSYAPKNIDVPVDEKIVERLREAYTPAVYPKWTLRAEIDLITNAPDGALLADERLVRGVTEGFVREGFQVARNGAYSLHPSSMGNALAARHPRSTLCIEMRRDLLAREFTPFAEMAIDPAKADRMARVLSAALDARR